LNAKFILSTYDEKWSEENIKKVNNYKWNKPLLFLTRKELSELA
jgi:hypothetical protein